MCQLLGLNAASPTPFSFCFKGFCRRGGETDVHKDGWGLALYEGRGLRTFLDVKACARSPVARFIRDYPTKTQNMIAHVRCATHGRVVLENVHPFHRELWGIPFAFAHNGEAAAFAHQRHGHHVLLGKAKENDLVYHAIGDTDSEAIFCAILNALRAEFRKLPTLSELHAAISRLMDELAQNDESVINNFLLGCGPNTLFCYSWPGRQPGSVVWNGLYYTILEPSNERPSNGARFEDSDFSLHFSPCEHVFEKTTEKDLGGKIAIIATKPRPLSDCTDAQKWVEMSRGELVMFDGGVPYTKSCDLEDLERKGRGLSSRCFHTEELLTQVYSDSLCRFPNN